MTLKTRPYDAAEFLDSPELIAEYIKESLATGDADIIRWCISDVIRAKENKPTLEELGLTEEDFIVTPWDIAEFLDSPEMITAYLKESLATGNKDIIRQCISDIIRAKGMIHKHKQRGS